MRTRTLMVVGVLVALLLAGVASFYASSHPDGLEYVAEKTGFLDTADEHAAADGPMADYSAKGVDDERVAGGVAGVTGALVVLVVAGGLAFAVRRRRPGAEPDGAGEPQGAPVPGRRQRQGRLRRPSDRHRPAQRPDSREQPALHQDS